MGLGIGLLLIAVGAVLTWAVTTSESSLDANAVGVILMVVGFVGLVVSTVLWSSWWGPGYFRTYAGAGPALRRHHRSRRKRDEPGSGKNRR